MVEQLERLPAEVGGRIAARPAERADRLQGWLEELASRHGVPGVAVGVLHDGVTTCAAAGVVNRRTGVEATPDTLWQIGSVSKVYTSTLVMQLADEGLVDLDAPIRRYLRGFRLADAAAGPITVRMLLTHTSGIDAELADHGRGDDCVRRYVASLRTAPVLWGPGEAWSYCNAGFILLGRLVEVLRGTTWDVALRERLTAPLGMEATVTLPEEALLHRTAAGHAMRDGSLQVVPEWVLPRSAAPAGLICAPAADVLRFAAMHMDGGLAAGGERVLSAASVAEMARPHVEVPVRHPHASQGLGWLVQRWGGETVLAHDGGTYGQLAWLRAHPRTGTAVVVLANGPAKPLFEEVASALLLELAGLEMPASLKPGDGEPGVDAAACAGLYAASGVVMEVEERSGRLRAAWWPGAGAADRPAAEDLEWVELLPSAGCFVISEPRNKGFAEVVFSNAGASGRPSRVHVSGRAAIRIEETL